MVVILNIDDCNLHRILVDSRRLVDVLFYDALMKMNILLERLKVLDALITRFSGKSILIEGTIVF